MELRGFRNSTASSAGTSTPSERQRALDRMRHSSSATTPLSQASCSLRTSALNVPSTWRTEHARPGPSSTNSRYASTTFGNSSATCLDVLMSLANATARRIGGSPATMPVPDRLARPFQQPTILEASSSISSPETPESSCCNRGAITP
ncbi:Uncharacterised protein [Mycobacterium tuberculosis]|nr:Uncharacterised protein [Mycobacterium tuberculosis]CKR26471.1 Uncharacterised protein [Mycobacterium tuberculosis]CKS75963.1 Uncharacterised protein [Mycobacterium tuberculosis]CNV53563.1 Uncharacterised protein [Mycobacterium tuberculosis]